MADRELRDLLEATQAELKASRDRLDELEAQSTEALEGRIAELEESAATMHARLEQGDTVRESWANRQSALERDLAISRTEQQRLRSQLESLALERRLVNPNHRRLQVAMVLAFGGIGIAWAGLIYAWLH